jgi:hypothetical protein
MEFVSFGGKHQNEVEKESQVLQLGSSNISPSEVPKET